MANMNPDITLVQVGIYELREVKIYPLSVANQLEATQIIAEVINSFASFEKMADSDVVLAFIGVLEDNLKTILKLVVHPDEEITFQELTNSQLEKIVSIIFDKNYKDVVKNSKDLIGKIKPLLTSMRSLPK